MEILVAIDHLDEVVQSARMVLRDAIREQRVADGDVG
jgi:hypothetical protein